MGALALRRLPSRDRTAAREGILDALLAARCFDGSFVDNPQIGRHAATALALLAFAALEVPAGVD